MKESELKTSTKQRVFIAIIAVLMLGASVAVYIAIILGGKSNASSKNSGVDDELIAELTEEYKKKSEEYDKKTATLSDQYFGEIAGYRSKIKAFNANSVNESKSVTMEDVKIGSGRELNSNSTDYGAFYIGWCSDESVFDSSFDSFDSPSKLKAPLIVESDSLIEGWYIGVAGMKIGGTRIITIPGELAYGESQEICGEKNSPLKFLITAVDIDKDTLKLSEEMSNLYTRLLYAQYGLTYSEE